MFFYKDSLFEEIYQKLKQSRFINDPYTIAKSLRSKLTQNIMMKPHDHPDAIQANNDISFKYFMLPNDLKVEYKKIFKDDILLGSKQVYKDQLIESFLDEYIKCADRFVGYDVYKLHVGYSHIHIMKVFENQKLKKQYTKISFDDFVKYITDIGNKRNITLDFKKSNYESSFDLNCDDLFEMMFHRLSVICWMREIKSNETAFEGKEVLLSNKLADIESFFYEMISNPLSAKYLRLKDVPYWYQNPMGIDKTKNIDRLVNQPHVFCYKFATDFMNKFFKHEIKASEANKEKYPELFESDGIKPSILHQGGSFLDGNFIFILDILLLSEFFGF